MAKHEKKLRSRTAAWLIVVAMMVLAGVSAGLPAQVRFHDLRHTCAALLIAQGAHPKAIQAHLGHSSIQVTMDRYGHLFPDALEQLADRLDAARTQAWTDPERIEPRDGLIQLPQRRARNSQ
jgi:integrase